MMLRNSLCVTFVVACAMLFTSCEINYEEGDISQELSQQTPLLEFFEATYTYKRTRNRLISISAKRARTFDQLEYVEFEDAAFIEVDANGEVLNTGSADNALLYFNGNIELNDNVVFQSFQYNATIHAPHLIWDDANQRISGKPDQEVEITRPSGTRIIGEGVEANIQERTITLKNTSGVVFPEEDL